MKRMVSFPKAERHHLEEAVHETIKPLSPEGDASAGHRSSATADDLQVEHGIFAYLALIYRLLKQKQQVHYFTPTNILEPNTYTHNTPRAMRDRLKMLHGFRDQI